MELNEMRNSNTFTSPQKDSSEPSTKAQSLLKDNYRSECQRWGLILPMVLGICAIAAVLLQQGCNNTSEGKEAKKIRAIARINLFKHCRCSFSDEQSALLSIYCWKTNDPGSDGKQIRYLYYSYALKWHKVWNSMCFEKEIEISCIWGEKWKKL